MLDETPYRFQIIFDVGDYLVANCLLRRVNPAPYSYAGANYIDRDHRSWKGKERYGD